MLKKLSSQMVEPMPTPDRGKLSGLLRALQSHTKSARIAQSVNYSIGPMQRIKNEIETINELENWKTSNRSEAASVILSPDRSSLQYPENTVENSHDKAATFDPGAALDWTKNDIHLTYPLNETWNESFRKVFVTYTSLKRYWCGLDLLRRQYNPL